MTDHTQRPGGESPVDLVGDVVAGFSRLVRGEFALATAEAKRSVSEAKGALGKLVVASVLGITALNVLAGAAVAALVAAGLAPIWATLVVGIVLLVVAYALIQSGLSQIKPSNLAPKRIMENLRQDAETLKSMVISDAASNNRPQ